MQAMHATKHRLLDAGLSMLLEHGYNDLGIQALLDATGTPKGSFYHHFKDKEDFALQVVDRYMHGVHAGLDDCLGDKSRPRSSECVCSSRRRRSTIETRGTWGACWAASDKNCRASARCSGTRSSSAFPEIVEQLTACLDEAGQRGDIPPHLDARRMASLLVDCWEGAALRSRLRREAAPLDAMLDFYFSAVAPQVS